MKVFLKVVIKISNNKEKEVLGCCDMVPKPYLYQRKIKTYLYQKKCSERIELSERLENWS